MQESEQDTSLRYDQLQLHPDLARAIDEAGYRQCMPVQAATFPLAFEGRDIYAQSQTGTGKTAAFLISIFQRMMTNDSLRRRKALIIAPTRELAAQIEGEARKLAKYLPVSMGCFYGGVSYNPQESMLRDDVQMIIGTPGRIIDLVQQGKMLLREVGFLVVDEADRMFDMGFIDDLRKLLRYLPPPTQRQTFLFSATLNFRIKNLAWEYMSEPHEIAIEPETVTVEQVVQELYHVGSDEKMPMLLGILAREKPQGAIIFCNQKFVAEEIARRLGINGVDCEYIMGDLPQVKRLQVIDRLKAGKIQVLVATDVAARGLDVTGLDLVVNYDLPMDAESYVHRIGRTARAGAAGKAVSLACEKFVYSLPAIEKYLGQKIPVCMVNQDLLLEDKSKNLRFSSGHSHKRSQGAGEHRRSDEHRRGDEHRNRGGQRRGEPGGNNRQRDGKAAAARPGSRPASQTGTAGNRPATKLAAKPSGKAGGRPANGPARPNANQAGRNTKSTSGNPYAMSSEERMRLYKERYAGSPENGATGKDQTKNKGPRPAAAKQTGSKAPAKSGTPKAAQASSKPAAQSAKKPGILDRIKNLFGKRKDK